MKSTRGVTRHRQQPGLPRLSLKIPIKQPADPRLDHLPDNISEHSELCGGWLSVESDLSDRPLQAEPSEKEEPRKSELNRIILNRRTESSLTQLEPNGCRTPSPPSYSSLSPVVTSSSSYSTIGSSNPGYPYNYPKSHIIVPSAFQVSKQATPTV